MTADLLGAPAQFAIAHPCDCLSVRPPHRSVAAAIAKSHPEANVHARRRGVGPRNLAISKDRPHPGTIEIVNTSAGRRVVAMFAQWAPGKPIVFPSASATHHDSRENRTKWFQQCLDKIDVDSSLTHVALPKLAAGGDWNAYRKMIDSVQARGNTMFSFHDVKTTSATKLSNKNQER